MSLLSSPSWCEPLPFDELVIREHLFYKKFTNSPFTGEVSGEWFGKLEKGKRNGEWLAFEKNGQLLYQFNYKNGLPDGLWKSFYKGGRLKSEGYFKKGQRIGNSKTYYLNGKLEISSSHENGKFEGLYESYRGNGLLKETGTYKNNIKQTKKFYINLWC